MPLQPIFEGPFFGLLWPCGRRSAVRMLGKPDRPRTSCPCGIFKDPLSRMVLTPGYHEAIATVSQAKNIIFNLLWEQQQDIEAFDNIFAT